ncbi:MAG: DUF951 domain-containing protein [Firmicutes bacterium]|nr:DUF951 domain-containing protein [Alicyclobacillaceae bacterium]MCL6496135.1 DUF951 domain-containing protein [Bacillota bacterium]
MVPVRYEVNQIVELKKPHPCGSTQWVILRTGIDFGLRCVGCGHRVLIPRSKFERAVRRIVALQAETSAPGQ